jgi:hypothetical protein
MTPRPSLHEPPIPQRKFNKPTHRGLTAPLHLFITRPARPATAAGAQPMKYLDLCSVNRVPCLSGMRDVASSAPPASLSHAPGRLWGRTDPRSIPCLEPNGSRLIIQEIFWMALMSYRIGCRKATMARGTPARSICGSSGVNPAADRKAATGPAWPIPSSRTSNPPGRSTRAASAAMAR